MKLSDDKNLQEDIDLILLENESLWDKLSGMSVLVTGATGLIGAQLVMALLNANAERNLGMTVYAVVRNREKAEKIFCYADKKTLRFIVQDIQTQFDFSYNIDYIVHGASATSSKFFVDHPVETILTAIEGTRNILELAKEKKVKGMVYLSSLEVYGTGDFGDKPIREENLGSINCMSVRSSYSEGKKMSECLCASYAAEYDVAVKVIRLCQTFGPGVGYFDNRVFAQFARNIIENKDIVLKTDGSTERNYCYIKDAVSSILTVLLKGKKGEAYNVANKDIFVTIRDMAQMLIEKNSESGCKLVFDVVEDASKLGYNPKIRLNLDTEKVETLGWHATIDLPEMYERMIDSMKHSVENLI